MKNYNLSKIKVLILEGSALFSSMLDGVCESFEIPKRHCTANVDTALKILSDNDTDLVISDWSPKLDGLGFIKKVRTAPTVPNPCIPIILCTAYNEIGQVTTARDAGMTEYLVKPVTAKSIYRRFVSVIEDQRPFVIAEKYVGPDRRRRLDGIPNKIERRRPVKIGNLVEAAQAI